MNSMSLSRDVTHIATQTRVLTDSYPPSQKDWPIR